MNKHLIIFIALIISAFLAVNGYTTHKHEDAHVQIDTYGGCIEHHTTYGIFSGEEICTKWNPDFNGLTKQQLYELHSLNEIYGYNMDALIFALFYLVFILGLLVWL